MFIVNESECNDENKYVKSMIGYNPNLEQYTDGDIRYFNQNPTYILTFDKKIKPTDEILNFICKLIQKMCIESIWRDPKHYDTDPVDIIQILHFINLKLKL